jgi:uncharacterized repeat protein (TIGR01451 family)
MKSSYAAIAAIVVIIVVIAGAVVVYKSRSTSPSHATYGVSVSISPSSQSGDNGATLTYTVTVHNTGGVSDNYALTVSDNPSPSLDPIPNWNPSVSPNSLTVSAGNSGTATLSVTVPLVASSGMSDNITVTASGTGVSASKTCTAEATAPTLQASVSIIDFAFQPSSITIGAGTTVVWTNTGSATHTVTSDSGIFDSGDISPGGTFQFTFENAGTYSYHCSIHTFMTGTVTVQ